MYDLAVAKLTETGLRGAIPELWVYAIHRRAVSTMIRARPSHTSSLCRWAPACHISGVIITVWHAIPDQTLERSNRAIP